MKTLFWLACAYAAWRVLASSARRKAILLALVVLAVLFLTFSAAFDFRLADLLPEWTK